MAAARAFVADQMRKLARIAFACAIVLSPFRAGPVLVSRPIPPIWNGYTDLILPIAEIALLSTLALWALSLAARPRQVSLGPAFLYCPLAGLLALAWLGVPFSIDPALSAYNAAELLAIGGFALYALNEIDSIATLAIPLAAMIAIQSVVGLGQLVEQRSIGLQALGELGLNPSWGGVSVVSADGIPRLLRAYGLTQHPNILGGVLAFALPLVALGSWSWRDAGDGMGGGVLAAGRARVVHHAQLVGRAPVAGRARVVGRAPVAGRAAAVGRRPVVALALVAGRALVVALLVAGLFATFSRTAWLAAAVGLAIGVAMLLLPRARASLPTNRRFWAAIAAGALVAVALALPYARYVGVRLGVADVPSVTETMSLGERSILADQALHLAAAHPLTGVGLATLPEAIRQSDPGLTFDFQPAHVVLLDVAAELGVLAALLYAVVLVAPWLALLRARSRWTPELAVASAALAAVTVAGVFDYYTWTWAPGRLWAWLVLALWAGAYVRARRRPADAR